MADESWHRLVWTLWVNEQCSKPCLCRKPAAPCKWHRQTDRHVTCDMGHGHAACDAWKGLDTGIGHPKWCRFWFPSIINHATQSCSEKPSCHYHQVCLCHIISKPNSQWKTQHHHQIPWPKFECVACHSTKKLKSQLVEKLKVEILKWCWGPVQDRNLAENESSNRMLANSLSACVVTLPEILTRPGATRSFANKPAIRQSELWTSWILSPNRSISFHVQCPGHDHVTLGLSMMLRNSMSLDSSLV